MHTQTQTKLPKFVLLLFPDRLAGVRLVCLCQIGMIDIDAQVAVN